jgi:ABC-type transport system substrate-binding protein
VRAQSPIVPGSFGYDPDFASEMGEFSRPRAMALLDMFGYVDRDGDGWREMPDGSPLVLELASSSSQLDRKQNELWKRYMNAVGLRIEFRIAQWPELLRMSLAGRLMMWGYSWQVGGPDSDIVFGLGYGPNKEQLNDARFDLPDYNALYEQQRVLPDGPERLRILHRAARVLTVHMPYKFHLHRVVLDLTQAWVSGYRRHPFTTRAWHLVDVVARRHEAAR